MEAGGAGGGGGGWGVLDRLEDLLLRGDQGWIGDVSNVVGESVTGAEVVFVVLEVVLAIVGGRTKADLPRLHMSSWPCRCILTYLHRLAGHRVNERTTMEDTSTYCRLSGFCSLATR